VEPPNQRFILLPREGLFSGGGPAFEVLTRFPAVRSTEPPIQMRLANGGDQSVRVIDSVAENGPKLVEVDDSRRLRRFNNPRSPIRAVPLVEYHRPTPFVRPFGDVTTAIAGGLSTVTIECVDSVSALPVPDAQVVAFTDVAKRTGDDAVTGADGRALLELASTRIERTYVYPPAGYWGAFAAAIEAANPIRLLLTKVDLSYTDAVRHYYPNSNLDLLTGVNIGIIDTGCGPHSDLNIVGGRNTVTGEPANAFQDGGVHGTHVAGLIGAAGTPPSGLRGMAPGAPLHAYRVFPAGDGGATNYSVLKAMIAAAGDQCDIVNLSLGGGPFDDIVEEAIRDARNQGMLVVVAAGNDDRSAVSYPAAYSGATAVSALGRIGTFPAGSLEQSDVMLSPAGSDQDEFIAAFSNVGPQIAVTAPGVGVLSTLPGQGFGPMSGTSMAAPVAAGAAACLLSRDPVVFGMARTRARSDAIERLLLTSCVRRGFGAVFEGFGLPDPALV
jgi:subtilisin